MIPHHQAIGHLGEGIASTYLLANNYEIIEKNWRYKKSEIDIIASKNSKLHFVEVKTRTSEAFGRPEDSIDSAKMNNLKKGAEAYLLLHPEWTRIQFDVVAVTLHGSREPEIFFIEDVFF